MYCLYRISRNLKENSPSSKSVSGRLYSSEVEWSTTDARGGFDARHKSWWWMAFVFPLIKVEYVGTFFKYVLSTYCNIVYTYSL